MKYIKVYKTGGSVLKKPGDFLKIAEKISRVKDKKICLVTSAIKGQTSKLVRIFSGAIPQPDFWSFERFVGFGEIQAAMLFEAAFQFNGTTAKAILPWMKEWPLYISLRNRPMLSLEKINEKRDFVLLAKSHKKIKDYIQGFFKKYKVLIIPGFVVKDTKGRIVTLGRGGSDISAFLIAELLKAKELILIKEVEGILNLDPKLQNNAKKIHSLDSTELGIIASSGAQVLNPISLKHQKRLKKVKVISFEQDMRKGKGTEIFFRKGITIKASDTIYTVLTFVGAQIPETSGILSKISSVLAKRKISIFSITISDKLIAIYVEKRRGESAYKLLSPILQESKNLKVLSIKRDIGKIIVRALKFINEPGIIQKIVTPISRQGVNIWEVLTVHTDVMVFIEAKDLKKTHKILHQVFNKER
jgi:aspartate kinase